MSQEFLLQNSWLIALALGSGLMLFVPMFNKAGSKRLGVTQATMLINQKKAVLIDVRTPELIEKFGRPGGAKQVQVSEFADKLPGVVKDQSVPVIAICQSGVQSQSAAKKIAGLGYTEVYSLDGGMNAWADAGMPVTRAKPVESGKGKGKAKPKAQA